MDDPRGVGHRQRFGRFDRDARRHPPGERAAPQAGVEGVADAELHREVGAPVEGLAEVVELEEVRMRQRGRGASLAAKSLERRRRRRVLRAQDLDGHFPSELHVLGFEDDAARAVADLAAEAIRRPRQLRGIGGRHPDRDGFAHRSGRGGNRALCARAQGVARFAHEAHEFGARAGRLLGPEGVQARGDSRADSALARLGDRCAREELREIRRRQRRVGVAEVGVVVRQLGDDFVEVGRGAACGRHGRHDHPAGRGVVEVALGIGREKSPPRAQLPEQDPERVNVDPPVAHLLPRDFRCDVTRFREDDARHRVAAPVVPARGAEVDELDLARVAHHHVLRRQIAVHDPKRGSVGPGAFVHVRECLRDLERDRDRVRPRDLDPRLDRALADVTERASFDVLDHGVRFAILVGAGLEHLRDARVLQLRLNPRFVEKSREKRAVVDVVAAHRLDDAGALRAFQPRRRREVDVAHAAACRELEQNPPTEDSRQ